MAFRSLRLTAALLVALAAPAMAQQWPQQPIHLIIPFGPGGGSDIVGRIIAQALQEKLGQPVVVENRPGAGGTIGNEVIARSPADGYTLGIMTAGQVIQAVMLKSLHYDARTAFDPVAQVATAGLIMVTRPDFPANNVAELVALAKRTPGKLVFGSPGFGATQHLAAELFKQTAGVDMLHVPFRTSPETTTACSARCRPASSRRSPSPARTAFRPCPRCRPRSSQGCCRTTTSPPGTACSRRTAFRAR
jgi:tripartite-type tricarboxylate transporter receptor subunit TctC